jgi:hypothetical protein
MEFATGNTNLCQIPALIDSLDGNFDLDTIL